MSITPGGIHLVKAEKSVVLVIPDTHFPFHHAKTFEFLRQVKKIYRPTAAVHIGDILDNYALSTYSKSTKSDTTAQEMLRSQSAVKELGRIFPEMKVCWGNHDLRLLKRASESGIPGEFLKSFGEIIGAPEGWKFAEKWEIDGCDYLHGDGFTGINAVQAVLKTRMRSTVFGHTHAGSIVYCNGIFGMNVGCLLDESSYAAEYAKFFKNRPFLGCGLVVNGVPHLIPMT